VGGLAPVVAGVPDGRGRVLGSGTNARLYASSFANPRPMSKIDQDIERLEGRLAQALNLDRVSRVFEFRDRSTSPGKPLTPNKSNEPETRSIWTGTEWVSGRSETSELRICFVCSEIKKELSPPNNTSHCCRTSISVLVYAF